MTPASSVHSVFLQPGYLLAQTAITEPLGKVVSLLQLISLVLFFGGFLFGCVSYMYGRPEGIKNALVASAIGLLGWAILEALFEIATGGASGIEISPL